MSTTFHAIQLYGSHASSTDIANGTFVFSAFQAAVNGQAQPPTSSPPFSGLLTTSVGSLVNLYVAVDARSEQGFLPPAQLTSFSSVKVEITGQQLVSADPSKTSYSLDLGQYTLVPSITATSFVPGLWDPANPPGPDDSVYISKMGTDISRNGRDSDYDVAYISFYIGNYTGNLTIKITANYTRPGTLVDIVNFNLVVQAPAVSSPTFISPTGGNVFQFGPFLEKQGGTHVDTPLAWNDPGYLNPQPGFIYSFGCLSGTVNAWTFQWSLTNGTPSTGYSYCTQLVRLPEPPEITYAKTRYNLHDAVLLGGSSVADEYYTKLPAPKDGSGNVQWGVDGGAIALTQFPWAYGTDDFTQFSANSGTLAVPPPNSIKDVNGVSQSFYADNANRLVNATFKPLDPLIEMNYNWQFVTHFVWHPDGGIPISLSQYRWSLDCNEYNVTADLTPTVANSLQTSSNWDLTKTAQTLGSNSFVPTYLQWYYNQWHYRGHVDPRLVVPRPKKAGGGGPNLAPMGSGPMGGAVTVPNFGNMALLPRGSSANTICMNSV